MSANLDFGVILARMGQKHHWARMREICEAEGEGHWVTINGEHVFINDKGEVTKGPQKWVGKALARHILIGAGIYRTSGNVDTVSKIAPMFDRPEVHEFEKNIPSIAKDYAGISIESTEHAAGVWESNREPSLLISGSAHDGYAVDALAARLGESALEKQMAVAVFTENPEGTGSMYELHGIKDEEGAVKTLLDHGFSGQSVVLGKGTVILLDSDSSMRDNVDRASKALGSSYTHTPGDVAFISEEHYGQAKAEYQAYRKGLGQTKEVQNLPAHRAQAAEQVTEADDGDGHWVTIDGSHVFISSKTGTITKGPTH